MASAGLLALLLGLGLVHVQGCNSTTPSSVPVCQPTSCTAEGKNCGLIPDGCGNVLSCGECVPTESCGGAGVGNVCGAGVCTATTCLAEGKNCGDLADGCGKILACGACVAPDSCGGGGVDNVCGLTPLVVNGTFGSPTVNGTIFSVVVRMSTSTGTDDIGGATIVVEFDPAVVTLPATLVSGADYVFHSLSGGNYFTATVTRPVVNQFWVNITLPFEHNNAGTMLAKTPHWTDVVTINFQIANPTGTAILSWKTGSPFWGIYDADNATLWQAGSFLDLSHPL